MADEVSVTETTGLGGNLMNSIKGMFMGGILVLAGIGLLFWNEGNYVNWARSLNETQGQVVSVDSAKVDSANENKPVHTSGKTATTDTLTDPVFAVSGQYIKLERTVEMYQWTEDKETKEEKNLGGGTTKTTTYKYKMEWSEEAHNSSNFHEQTGHQNPPMPYKSDTQVAGNVTLGAFKMGPEMVDQLDQWESVAVNPELIKNLPSDIQPKAKAQADGFYVGADPSVPKIGDLRITFKVVNPALVSLIGRQSAGMLVPHQTQAGGKKVAKVVTGQVPADEMFKGLQSENKLQVWALRFVGWLIIAIGFSMLMGPLVSLANILPFLGNLVGAGVSFFSALISGAISTIVIAIAWMTYRPMVAIPLLIGAAAMVFLVRQRGASKNAAAPA